MWIAWLNQLVAPFSRRRLRQGPPEVPEYPPSVIIEVTNACNLRCTMCPIYGEGVVIKREIGYLPETVWRPAIDELGTWPIEVALDLHGAGEPMLHSDFFHILAYAKRQPNLRVGFLTNGTLLDEQAASNVMDLSVDWMGVSVDGAERDKFNHYRRGADLQIVEENVERLLGMRKEGKPFVFLNMVGLSDLSVEAFIARWKGKVDQLTISRPRATIRETAEGIARRTPCRLLYDQLVVGWNGGTGLCCEDYWGDRITGLFPEQSLYGIWHGREFAEARRLHEEGRAHDVELCRHCDLWLDHEYDEHVYEVDGHRTFVRVELPTLKV